MNLPTSTDSLTAGAREVKTFEQAVDDWMKLHDISSFDEFQMYLAEESVGAREHGSETVLDRMGKALAVAIEEHADDICAESKANALWLHAPTIAGKLIDSLVAQFVFDVE